MKGQSGLEYILLLAVLLAIITPMFIYSTQTSTLSLRTTTAKETVNIIADAANRVYKLGGGKTYVTVNIPSGVTEYYIGDKTIKLTLIVGDGQGDAVAFTTSEVTGNLPTAEGRYKILIEYIGNNTMLIQAYDDSPPIVMSTYPAGMIPNTDVTIKVMTNEASTCNYDYADGDYDSMSSSLSGSGTTHQDDLYGLAEGPYMFYTRCRDPEGNTMTSSAIIAFYVNESAADILPPEVSGTFVNLSDPKIMIAGDSVCISAVATDNVAVDKAWLLITRPSEETMNVTITQGGCVIGVDTFSAMVQFTEIGNYTVNSSFANDTSGNIGFESPYPNINIEVRAGVSQETCELLYPCPDYADIGIDSVFYYKTNGLGLDTADDEMAASTDITLDCIDDNVNTPDVSSVIRTRLDEKYECFVPFINNDTSVYSKIIIYGRVSIIDQDPFILRVYPYKSDGLHINSSIFADFSISRGILDQKVKWVELDVSDVGHAMDGYGFTKFRITAFNASEQTGDRFQFSELHFKVSFAS